MLRTESTFTLARLSTYESMDESVRQFSKRHKVVSIESTLRAGKIGYLIVWDDENE